MGRRELERNLRLGKLFRRLGLGLSFSLVLPFGLLPRRSDGRAGARGRLEHREQRTHRRLREHRPVSLLRVQLRDFLVGPERPAHQLHRVDPRFRGGAGAGGGGGGAAAGGGGEGAARLAVPSAGDTGGGTDGPAAPPLALLPLRTGVEPEAPPAWRRGGTAWTFGGTAVRSAPAAGSVVAAAPFFSLPSLGCVSAGSSTYAERSFARHSMIFRSFRRPNTSPRSSKASKYVQSSWSLASSAASEVSPSPNTRVNSVAGST